MSHKAVFNSPICEPLCIREDASKNTAVWHFQLVQAELSELEEWNRMDGDSVLHVLEHAQKANYRDDSEAIEYWETMCYLG